MKSGIKIIHWAITIWLCIVILRFDLIIDYFSLVVDYFRLIISDPSNALNVLNFGFVDASFSSLLFILILPLILIFRGRFRFLETKLNFSGVFLILLCFVFLFAPIITNENPEFSKNLSVTKLLPPVSFIKQIELKEPEVKKLTGADDFRNKAAKIIKPAFNINIIFADSAIVTDKVVYFQKNKSFNIDRELVVSESGMPIVKNKLFLFGSDEFGRDLFARLIYGTRISITVGLGAVLLSFIIGILLGFIAGYRGGILDVSLNRFTEMFLAFPVIYLIVLILALFGSSMVSVIVVLGISGWMSLFKIVKSEVLSIKHKDYFATAELVGLNKFMILKREVFPVIITPVLVNLVFLFSNVVLAEAALSYLGLGTGNSYPSWGSMISSGSGVHYKSMVAYCIPRVGLNLNSFYIQRIW